MKTLMDRWGIIPMQDNGMTYQEISNFTGLKIKYLYEFVYRYTKKLKAKYTIEEPPVINT